MKRFILFALCLVLGGSIAVSAQDSKDAKEIKKQERIQRILEKNEKKAMYKAEVEANMHGLRMGGEYSFRTLAGFEGQGVQKHGIHYLAGYRFTKRWYVGGIVGVDVTTPFKIVRSGYADESLNFSIDRKDKVYVPIMADVRFYCNVNRISTFLYANLGAEFSSSTAIIGLWGLGFRLGIGLGQYESAKGNGIGGLGLDADPGYGKYTGFAFNLRLGYSF